MTVFKFANFIATELEEGISAGETELIIPLAASEALPMLQADEEIRLVLWDGQQDPEIVGVTENPQTGVLTVSRAKEDTTAVAWAAGTQVKCVLTAEIINAALEAFFDIDTILSDNFLPLAGGTLTGPLTLSSAPSLDLHAATKLYVDSVIGNNFLPVAGGTMIGPILMGGNAITGLPAPTAASAATNKAYVDSIAVSGVKWKEPVRIATTADGTFSTAYDNGSTVDGVVLATGDRILIKNQIDQTQNGIYVVQAAGSPVRATDANANDEVPGATVFVEEGTANTATQWTCTNTSVTLGVTAVNFVLIAAGVLYTADDTSLLLTGTVFSIKNLGVTTAKLADNAVTTVKITDLNVTDAKIANATLTFGKLSTSIIATALEAQAGVVANTLMTPQRTQQFFEIRDATQAEVLAESVIYKFVDPAKIRHNLGVAKAWGVVNAAGSLIGAHNITSVSKGGTGIYNVTLEDTMFSVNYSVLVTPQNSTEIMITRVVNKTTTGFTVHMATWNTSTLLWGFADIGFSTAVFSALA